MNNIAKSSYRYIQGSACLQRSMSWSGSSIVEACAVDADYGHLLVLTEDGAVHGVDLDKGVCLPLCAVELPGIPAPDSDNQPFGAPRYRLHATANGLFAAIVVDCGREGLMFDVRTGAVTLRLHGGDYDEDTVPFSACFLCFEGRDVLVHRTDWNRLDVAEPATGASLVDRYIAPYISDSHRPLHYLDYFHGQLLPSPDGRWLFDDGWVWHPSSIPRVWSATDWLTSNPWESEDGPSIVELTFRNDWSTPACWIGNTHLALWGLAEWDTAACEEVGQGPGLRIFSATERDQFVGGRWPMEVDTKTVRDLFSDGMRLCVATDDGTRVWDIATRAQVAYFDGLVAHLLDARRHTLVAIAPDTIVEWALP